MGTAGFGSVLKKIADYWDTRPSEVLDQAKELMSQLQGLTTTLPHFHQ